MALKHARATRKKLRASWRLLLAACPRRDRNPKGAFSSKEARNGKGSVDETKSKGMAGQADSEIWKHVFLPSERQGETEQADRKIRKHLFLAISKERMRHERKNGKKQNQKSKTNQAQEALSVLHLVSNGMQCRWLRLRARPLP